MTDQELEQLLRENDQDICRDAKIPSAGLIYWRASIRARCEAARKVEQPFTIVQGIAAASVAGIGVALGGFAWQSWTTFPTDLGVTTLFGLGVAALVVISPLALVALGSRMRFDRPQD